jgi:imidazolonepropionase
MAGAATSDRRERAAASARACARPCAAATEARGDPRRSIARLRRMAELGVTTVEVKSGYGLEPRRASAEQLRAIARARNDASLPARRADLPRAARPAPESATVDARGFAIVRASRRDRPRPGARARTPRSEYVDAYVDQECLLRRGGTRLLAKPRARHGLGIRLHVGQFADVGGAKLAPSSAPKSADHLEHVRCRQPESCSPEGGHTPQRAPPGRELRRSDQAPPPDVALLCARAFALVVASDANPGTAPSESLPLAMAFAVRSYGLTVGRGDGSARPARQRAPSASPTWAACTEAPGPIIVGWDLPHEAAVVMPWGTSENPLRAAWRPPHRRP